MEEAIKIQNLEKKYSLKGGKYFYALKDFSLTIPKGQIVCLLGPNGSGKTTTINILNGLLQASSGTVEIMGLSIKKNIQKIREIIATQPQETALYNDLTGRENLLFHAQYYGIPKNEWKKRIDDLLELIKLTERQNEKVGSYSGGMQRRLALARSLLTNPKIIFLDEPTLGVDVQSKNAIWNEIKRLKIEGKTILLTTNYMEEADELADIIHIIDHGQMVVSGTPKELKEKLENYSLKLEFNSENAAEIILKRIPKKFQISKEKNNIVLRFFEKEALLKLLFSLDKKKILNFELREPTLNDVFLKFTGKKLRD